MLRISKKADYAVFLLGAIARQGAFPGGSAQGSVVSAHEIARQAGLNKSVVANLLKEFSRHGVLDSVRGLRGGYRLAHAPKDISLGQILEVVEGKFVLVDCVPAEPVSFLPPKEGEAAKPEATKAETDNSHDCSLIAFCPSKQPMRVVHQRIHSLFEEIRLDELCSLTPVCASDAAATADGQN